MTDSKNLLLTVPDQMVATFQGSGMYSNKKLISCEAMPQAFIQEGHLIRTEMELALA